MTTDRAALRLALSAGELVCPRKGQMGKGRCVQMQEEMGCTCPTAVVAGCAIGPLQAPPPAPAPPERSRIDLIRASAARVAARRRPAATAATTPAPPPPPSPEKPALVEAAPAATTTAPTTDAPAGDKPAAPAKEKPMSTNESNTPAMLAAVQADREREWTLDELLKLRGGGRTALYQELSQLTKRGTLERTGPGKYKAAYGAPAGKPEKPAKPVKAKAAPPKPKREAAKPERPAADQVAPTPPAPAHIPTPSSSPAAAPPPPVLINRVESIPSSPGRPARLRIFLVEMEGDLSDTTMRAALEELRRAVG